jgi:hypothetical protein
VSCFECLYTCKDTYFDGVYCGHFHSILSGCGHDTTRGLYTGQCRTNALNLGYHKRKKDMTQTDSDILFLDNQDSVRQYFY